MSTVSIVIPAYNAAKYISATIESVQAQTYIDWEIIIINDGSNDNTEEVIGKYLSDKRINYYSQKNTGVSIARNNGIAKTTGEYIAFLDADDVWEPGNLQKKVSLLNENPEIGWTFSDMYEADEHLQEKRIAAAGKDNNILEDILLWESEVVPGPCSNLVIRRSCIEDIWFDPDLSTAADQDFCLQLAVRCKGKRIQEPLWTYRVIGSSMSRNIRIMEYDHIYVYQKADKNRLFRSFRFKQKCFGNMYLILAGSWWVNGNNKTRAIFFLIKAVLAYPPHVFKLMKKLLR